MNFTIFRPLIIIAAEPVTEVREKLSRDIEERRFFNSLRSNKTYQGEITENTFKISRIISGQNSFLPVIYGSFKEEKEGTEIKMNLVPDCFVIVFFVFWCVGFFGPDVSSFMRGDLDSFSLFSLIFVVVFTGMFPYFLYSERKKTQENFRRILNIKQ